jgi:hypothetical protein
MDLTPEAKLAKRQELTEQYGETLKNIKSIEESLEE